MNTAVGSVLCKRGSRGSRAECIWLAPAVVLALSCPVHADCLDDAAANEGVPPVLLRAVAQHESAMRSDAVHRNANGSLDIGLMQINSGWLPILKRYGIVAHDLLDPCVNAYVGAWIIRSNVARFGATWKAVGAYNASSPDGQLRYADAVYGVLVRQSAPTNARW